MPHTHFSTRAPRAGRLWPAARAAVLVLTGLACAVAAAGADFGRFNPDNRQPDPGRSAATAPNSTPHMRRVSSDAPPETFSAMAPPAQSQSQGRVSVKLTLPPVGHASPSRMRMVEVSENGDGTLDFQASRIVAEPRDSGIPGLLTPELLAMDKYQPPGAFVSLDELAAIDGHKTGEERQPSKSEAGGYWPTIFLPPDLTLMTPGADIVLLNNTPREARRAHRETFLPLPELAETPPESPPPMPEAPSGMDLAESPREIETPRIPISSLRPPPSGATPPTGLFDWASTPSGRVASTAAPRAGDAPLRPPPAASNDAGDAGTPLFSASILPEMPSMLPERRGRTSRRPRPRKPIAPTPELHGTEAFGVAQPARSQPATLFSQRGVPAAEVLQSPGTVSLLPPSLLGSSPGVNPASIGGGRRLPAGAPKPPDPVDPRAPLPKDANGITPVYAVPNLVTVAGRR